MHHTIYFFPYRRLTRARFNFNYSCLVVKATVNAMVLSMDAPRAPSPAGFNRRVNIAAQNLFLLDECKDVSTLPFFVCTLDADAFLINVCGLQ